MPYKNTAVTVLVLAWDTVNNTYKTGDSANITVRGVGDGTEFTPAAPSITEVDSTNLPGRYKVTIASGENNVSWNAVGGKSSTANIVIIGTQWWNETTADAVKVGGTTQTGRDLGASVLLSSGTGTGQVSLSSGAVTVGTNNDKTGYTVSTNSDKTGYTIASSGLDSAALTAAAKNAIADSVLDRNMTTGTDSGTDSTAVRTPRQALRILRNKASIAAGTLTVTKEDDSTASWTAAVTTTAGNPTTAVDPT